MKCSISHVDVCLPCYVPDHRWIGVPVDNTTTQRQALDALTEEWASDGYHNGEQVTDAMIAVFNQTVADLIYEHAAHIDTPIAPNVEGPDAYADGECVYAWFTVHFTED